MRPLRDEPDLSIKPEAGRLHLVDGTVNNHIHPLQHGKYLPLLSAQISPARME